MLLGYRLKTIKNMNNCNMHALTWPLLYAALMVRHHHINEEKKEILKNLPPVPFEDGSTAKIATRYFISVSIVPKHSINVLLPAPGGPESPVK